MNFGVAYGACLVRRSPDPCEVNTMERSTDQSQRSDLSVGASIEVRSHFRGEWTRGFEVAETTDDGYRVRRLSDRSVLPVEFTPRDIRRARP
jgi:hypothetical protein